MRFPIRHLATVGALVLISTVPLAACGDEVAPLPAEAAAPAVTTAATSAAPTASSAASPTSAPPGAATTASPKARPARTPVTTTTTRPESSCWGSIRYDLDLQNTELALVRSMCFHTGGVLRLQGIGPGLVTAEPRRLVTQNYEGGVVDIRFVRAGTVTVTIPQDEQTHTITVVVRS